MLAQSSREELQGTSCEMRELIDCEYDKWRELVEGGPGQKPGRLTRLMLILNAFALFVHVTCLCIEGSLVIRTTMRMQMTGNRPVRVDEHCGITLHKTMWRNEFDKRGWVYVTWLALSIHFFAIASHLAVTVTLSRSYFRPEGAHIAHWYWYGLYTCRAWWR